MLVKKLIESYEVFFFQKTFFENKKIFFQESTHTKLSAMKTLHLFRLMLMLMDDKKLMKYSSNQLSV